MEVKNKVINLEMNKEYYKGIIEKNNRYLDKISNGLVKTGDKYKNNIRVIQINFDNYWFFDERLIIKFQMMDKEKGIVRSEELRINDPEIYDVNLKMINKMHYNVVILNTFERELLLITLNDRDELEKVARRNKIMEEVTKKISSLSEEEQTQGIYIEEEQDAWIRSMMIADAKSSGLDQGLKQGIRQEIKKVKKKALMEQKRKSH